MPETEAASPQVTLFTMTYNQRDKVLALLRDLADQTYPASRLTVVVLDDGGTDGTGDVLREIAPDLPYRLLPLRREHEAHYLTAQRWNECIAAGDPDTQIWIQVDDVRVRPDFVERHVAWHTGSRLRLVTGAKFEGDEETWSLSSCRRARLAAPDGVARTGVPWTAAWAASFSYPATLVEMLSTSDIQRPFDAGMTGYGLHEVEFGARAQLCGAEIVYDPAVGVFHQNHNDRNDHGRGIDHAAQVAARWQNNARYLCRKHGITALPPYDVLPSAA
ncbi:glycosyltransferase family 2 protein [Micromonospora sp. NPDC049900]|uniref:glycosyltransferase family 2 protein n=1 Tax=Micromonospora sp. NPDC049900 TaxID=3364275 RepID=UPI00379B06F2